MTTLSERLGGFAAALTYGQLPDTVTADVRARLVDIVGLCCAALALPSAVQATAVARRWGGPGEARVVGSTARMPAPAAAFVNGVLAHAQDFDDTHLPSVLHPSASLLPAALAVAEAEGRGVHALIAAAMAGYEVCIRTGMAGYDAAARTSSFFERGWHATAICGALGSAVVAAKLMGLDAAGITHALGIATSMGAGLLEANRVGGSVKQLHCGWAAHSGIIAAQCAAAGVTAAPSALEGRFGLFQSHCGTFDADAVTDGLGTRWSTARVFYKPYPANHFTHAAIDAALRLREKVRPERITAARLGVAAPVLRTIAEPREAKLRPESGYHARFSGPFAVATAFHADRAVDLSSFSDERARDPRLLALAARVECHADPACDAIFPDQFPAILRVRTDRGEWLEERVLVNRGGPEHPLTREELLTKFRANTRASLPPAHAERIADALLTSGDRPVAALPWPTAEDRVPDRPPTEGAGS